MRESWNLWKAEQTLLGKIDTFDTGKRRGILAEDNPENISGGYLIEKDSYYDKIKGFVTEGGNGFSFKAPEYATKEQVDYIADYVQQIETIIFSNDDTLFGYIDLKFFILRYLLDEAVLNQDTGVTSMYFY